jgi:hypothetical protein
LPLWLAITSGTSPASSTRYGSGAVYFLGCAA